MLAYLNQENFENTLKNNDVVLVDFYADWCGPCQAIHPILEDVAEQFDGKATIAKVNVDTNPELAGRFNVRSIPALFYFKGGELVKTQVGMQSQPSLAGELNALVAA
ncbi:MAG: thioredoxin [Bacteroidota bacterium]